MNEFLYENYIVYLYKQEISDRVVNKICISTVHDCVYTGTQSEIFNIVLFQKFDLQSLDQLHFSVN